MFEKVAAKGVNISPQEFKGTKATLKADFTLFFSASFMNHTQTKHVISKFKST